MAESFKNYNTSILNTNSAGVVVVPPAIAVSDTSDVRESGTVAQIHSIYISQIPENEDGNKIHSLNRYNPAYFTSFNLYIKDNNSKISYIVYDGRIVPGAPFFIEKNITLEPTQYLVISCPSDSYDIDTSTNESTLLNKPATLHISASAVLFPTSD